MFYEENVLAMYLILTMSIQDIFRGHLQLTPHLWRLKISESPPRHLHFDIGAEAEGVQRKPLPDGGNSSVTRQ